MDIVPLVTAFAFVFLAEFGDKTQVTAIMLSSRSSAFTVFAGSMLAFFLVDGLSALIGGELLGFLPDILVKFGSGLLFIIFGVFSLIRNEEKISVEEPRATFLKTFLLIALMELGDKTQVASIVLAAEFKNPLMVLAGIMLGFSIVTGIGVILGSKLLRLIPERYLRIGTALLFIFFGFIFILNAITL